MHNRGVVGTPRVAWRDAMPYFMIAHLYATMSTALSPERLLYLWKYPNMNRFTDRRSDGWSEELHLRYKMNLFGTVHENNRTMNLGFITATSAMIKSIDARQLFTPEQALFAAHSDKHI